MIRLWQNGTVRNLLVLVCGLLVAMASAYTTFALLKAFEADPVDVGALVKGGLAAFGLLLFFGAATVMTVRAEAAKRKPQP